jgi:Glycoside hydrolase family 44
MQTTSLTKVLHIVPIFIVTALPAPADAADAAEAKPITFTVDAPKPGHEISPYIYGVNAHGKDTSMHPSIRLGGNRWTAYNWETNASNAGSDWHHQNDGFLSASDEPAQAVRPAVEAAAKAHQAIILTVPICGYVSADKNGDGDVNQTPDYLRKRFHPSHAAKKAPFSLTPDRNDDAVYQDEFVNFVEKRLRTAAGEPTIFYALDNEPALWSETHARIHPKKVTYGELVEKSIDHASAIKAVNPKALVFGPVCYGWAGMRTLQDAPDGAGRDFLDFYLAQMKAAEAKHGGRRLLDVLDVHWYPEARGGDIRIAGKETAPPELIAARVQAPRSLWDPTYVESSWITRDALGGKAIQLLPRLHKSVEANYPGTKIAVTEYNYGGGNHISGAIAQADVLGVFGRENIFAANWWDLGNGGDFVNAAFQCYLNYDGKGSRFGSRSLPTTSSDIALASIYASNDAAADATEPAKLVVVLINRSDSDLAADVRIATTRPLKNVETFRLTSAAPAIKPAGAAATLADANHLRTALPPMSVSVLRVTP